MSSVVVAPDLVTTAASDLAGIGSAIAAAAVPTSGLLAAAADAVSVQIVAVFGAHAHRYQALGAQAAALHDEFVRANHGGNGGVGGNGDPGGQGGANGIAGHEGFAGLAGTPG